MGSEMVFGGLVRRDSPYAVVGVPFERNPSFREGTRWAPLEIRKASNFIEFRSELTGLDADEIGFDDRGDLPVSHDAKTTLAIVEDEVKKIKKEGKIPIVLGGEHTITYAAVKASRPNCLVVMDAHLDARGEYHGDRWSHACWLRRLLEELDVKVFIAGARAYVDEEVRFLNTKKAMYANGLSDVSRFLRDCESIYLSLDMDYFDPSVAPGVSNPEPGGKTFKDFLELLNVLRRFRLVGADVVELSPPYDRDGVTAVLAARAVVEIATSFWSPPRALQGPCC